MKKLIEPMLVADSVKFNKDRRLIAEPKADGWRIMASITKEGPVFYTRGLNTEPFTSNLQFLADELPKNLPKGITLDGELVRDEFKTIAHWRREYLTDEEIREMAQDTVWMLFDIYDPKHNDILEIRKRKLRKLIPESQHILIAPEVRLKSEQHLMKVYKEAIEDDLEGLVVKDLDSVYRPGIRPDHWMKMKAFETRDGKIIGFNEGKGMNKGSLGSLNVLCGKKVVKVAGFDSKNQRQGLEEQKEISWKMGGVFRDEGELAYAKVCRLETRSLRIRT